MNCRNQFTFYKSFDDVYCDLSDPQKLEFMQILLDVQFLRVKVCDIDPKDIVLKHIWNAQKHSIEKSVKGYLDSQKGNVKNPYLGIYDPLQIPSVGGRGQDQVKDQEQEKVKEKVKEKEEFSFSLSRDTHFSNVSGDYKTKLKQKIESSGFKLSYEDFENSLLSKASYKYKNFWLVYQKWAKNQNQQSSQQNYKPKQKFSLVDEYYSNKEKDQEYIDVAEN